jgi:protein O-mannosyl-transferase
MIAGVVIVFIVALLVFSNALEGDFVFDDNFAILNNNDVDPAKSDWSALWLHDFWGQEMNRDDSHKSYRPLTTLTFRLNLWLMGKDPWAFHVVNTIIHCIVSVQVALLAREALIGANTKWLHGASLQLPQFSLSIFTELWVLCGILFVVHPAHAEAVASIVGRADLLVTMLVLLTRTVARQVGVGRPWIVLVAFSALLCKESAVFALVAVLVECLLMAFPAMLSCCRDRIVATTAAPKPASSSSSSLRRSYLMSAVYIALAIGLSMLVRFWLTPTIILTNYRRIENPLAFHSGWSWLTFWLVVQREYARLVLWPAVLSADYSFDCIPSPTEGWLDIRVLEGSAVLLMIVTLLYVIHRYWRSDLLVSLWLLSATFHLPASQTLFSIGTLVAERLVYATTAPLIALLAGVISRLVMTVGADIRMYSGNTIVINVTVRRLLASLLLLLLIGLSTNRLHLRNKDWQSEETLFRAAYQDCPRSTKVLQNMGILERRFGRWDTSIEHFRTALSIEGDYCENYYWIGLSLLNKGSIIAALPHLRKGVACKYTRSKALEVMATLHNSMDQLEPMHVWSETEAFESAKYVGFGGKRAYGRQMAFIRALESAELWDEAWSMAENIASNAKQYQDWQMLVHVMSMSPFIFNRMIQNPWTMAHVAAAHSSLMTEMQQLLQNATRDQAPPSVLAYIKDQKMKHTKHWRSLLLKVIEHGFEANDPEVAKITAWAESTLLASRNFQSLSSFAALMRKHGQDSKTIMARILGTNILLEKTNKEPACVEALKIVKMLHDQSFYVSSSGDLLPIRSWGSHICRLAGMKKDAKSLKSRAVQLGETLISEEEFASNPNVIINMFMK